MAEPSAGLSTLPPNLVRIIFMAQVGNTPAVMCSTREILLPTSAIPLLGVTASESPGAQLPPLQLPQRPTANMNLGEPSAVRSSRTRPSFTPLMKDGGSASRRIPSPLFRPPRSWAQLPV